MEICSSRYVAKWRALSMIVAALFLTEIIISRSTVIPARVISQMFPNEYTNIFDPDFSSVVPLAHQAASKCNKTRNYKNFAWLPRDSCTFVSFKVWLAWIVHLQHGGLFASRKCFLYIFTHRNRNTWNGTLLDDFDFCINFQTPLVPFVRASEHQLWEKDTSACVDRSFGHSTSMELQRHLIASMTGTRKSWEQLV